MPNLTTRAKSECLGSKICSDRWRCPQYQPCIDARIVKHLNEGWSPRRILRDQREVRPSISDFVLLTRIANIAKANGFQFSRPFVDTAIEDSNIGEDGASKGIEGRIVRQAFGVFGREGRRVVKDSPRDGTEREEPAEDAQGSNKPENTPLEVPESPQSAQIEGSVPSSGRPIAGGA